MFITNTPGTRSYVASENAVNALTGKFTGKLWNMSISDAKGNRFEFIVEHDSGDKASMLIQKAMLKESVKAVSVTYTKKA